MKLHAFVLCLDSMPFITCHLPIFQALNSHIDWHLHFVHGTAMNGGSTAWCALQEPRLSLDGTAEYLKMIEKHPRVSVYHNDRWVSKDAMCNMVVRQIHEPCILMQVDSDEIWRTNRIERVCDLFDEHGSVQRAYFRCRYFVGPNLITEGKYGNGDHEWLRVWRFQPGMEFDRHEPPVLAGNLGAAMSRDFTFEKGLTFDHYSWAFEHQAAYKEFFYRYGGARHGWRLLQGQRHFPVKLKEFFHWSDDNTIVKPA